MVWRRDDRAETSTAMCCLQLQWVVRWVWLLRMIFHHLDCGTTAHKARSAPMARPGLTEQEDVVDTVRRQEVTVSLEEDMVHRGVVTDLEVVSGASHRLQAGEVEEEAMVDLRLRVR